MNKTWKIVLPLLLSGGLVACSTTGESVVEPEQTPQTQEPEVTTPEVTSPDTSEPEPTVPQEPEVKPEPKPEKPVAPKPTESPKKTADGKLMLGEQEWVYVPGLEASFKARIDTGATTSSISAVEVLPFERDGKDWVKFKIEHEGVKSREIALPVQRWVKIRQSTSEESEKRAVVEGWIQIGDVKEKTEFTLADRTHLTYPILLGRSFFKDIAVVDVSRTFIQDKHK